MEDEQSKLKSELLELLKLPGNATCADCSEANPDWASTSLGVFVCVACSGVHRQLGVHISRVKSVRLDNWKAAEVEEMRRQGNLKANSNVMARLNALKPFYQSPVLPSDGTAVREQWIRAKYERKEFSDGSAEQQQSEHVRSLLLAVPVLEEWAVKRGAKRKNWKRRWLSLVGTTLTYYSKKTDAVPKGVLTIREVTEISPVREPFEGHEWTLQIQCGERSFYVAFENALRMFEWLQTLRAVRRRFIEALGGVRRGAERSVQELVARAATELVLRTRKCGKKNVDNTFLGSQLVDWLMAVEQMTSREDATLVADQLLATGKIRHAGLPEITHIIDGFEPYVWQDAPRRSL